MVLSLPILLFLMALMINYGTVASWKVRTLSMARNVNWAGRWPRTPSQMPRPENWPASARASRGGAGNVAALDDPRIDHPIARGPLPPAEVRDELLDPTRGLRVGSAELRRNFPLMPKLGPYELRADHRILDDKWQYSSMGLPSNGHWRILAIYNLPRAGDVYVTRYVQAVVTLLTSPVRIAVRPLDRDEELRAADIHRDFHPKLDRFCSLDPEEARDKVEDLIDHIQGNADKNIRSVADRMVSFFTWFYQQQQQGS